MGYEPDEPFVIDRDTCTLDEYKKVKHSEVDRRTGQLIKQGFSYDGKTFSLSETAQLNLLGVHLNRKEALLIYPIVFNTIDDTDTYSLADESDVFNFLKLVIQTHTDAIAMYIARKKNIKPTQVRFIYKGGNVLRIVASEFLVELPGYAADTINDFYMQIFKRKVPQ